MFHALVLFSELFHEICIKFQNNNCEIMPKNDTSVRCSKPKKKESTFSFYLHDDKIVAYL